jgi:hypothetical protein
MRDGPVMSVHVEKSFASLSREELIAHLEMIQRHYTELKFQRDELQRDVELLCVDGNAATFDKTSFLQERCRTAEAELGRMKNELSAVTVELYDVKEDNLLLKEAKRVSDSGARQVFPSPPVLSTT